MGDGVMDAQSDAVTDGDGARGDRARTDPGIVHADHAKGSTRIPTVPPDDETRRTELRGSVEHEDVASSGLMAEAYAQLEASGQLRLISESDTEDPDDLDGNMRRAPAKRLTADVHPAVAMGPLARPAGTPSPADLLAAKRAGELRGESLDLDAVAEIVDRPVPGVRPVQRMQRIPREPPPAHTDPWVVFAACVLIVAVFATITLLLTR